MATHTQHPETQATDAALNLVCPDCQYSLRGLPGLIVRCPECGRTCDKVRIATLTRLNWALTPSYKRLARPATSAILAPLIGAIIMTLLLHDIPRHLPLGFIAMCMILATLIGIWAWQLFRSVHTLPAEHRWWAATMLHVVMLGYSFAGVLILVGGISLLLLIVELIQLKPSDSSTVVLLALIGCGVLGYFACAPLYRFDRSVGRVCVKHDFGEHSDRDPSEIGPDAEQEWVECSHDSE